MIETQGMRNQQIQGTDRTPQSAEKMDRELGMKRSQEISSKIPKGENRWSAYPQQDLASPKPGKGD